MDKTLTKILIAIAGGIALGAFLFSPRTNLGGGSGRNSWGAEGVVNTSSTLVANVATQIVSADSDRSYVSVCTRTVEGAHLSLSNTTGSLRSAGFHISGVNSATSTSPTCWESETYKGGVVAESEGAAQLSIIR